MNGYLTTDQQLTASSTAATGYITTSRRYEQVFIFSAKEINLYFFLVIKDPKVADYKFTTRINDTLWSGLLCVDDNLASTIQKSL